MSRFIRKPQLRLTWNDEDISQDIRDLRLNFSEYGRDYSRVETYRFIWEKGVSGELTARSTPTNPQHVHEVWPLICVETEVSSSPFTRLLIYRSTFILTQRPRFISRDEGKPFVHEPIPTPDLTGVPEQYHPRYQGDVPPCHLP